MPDSFVTRIERECLRQRRMQFAIGTCWAVVSALLVAMALVLLDRLLGIQDVVGRWLWTSGFLACCLFILFRWRRVAWNQPISVFQIASQLESRYPKLRDLVTSGLEFSRQAETDPCAGSLALRRAIVVRAATETQSVDWKRLADIEPLKNALLSFLGVLLLLGLVAWSSPQSFRIGLVRLINPASTAEWPRDHHLRFIDPPVQVSAGEDVLLNLEDTEDTLPKEVTFFVRVHRNGRWQEEQETRVTSGEQVAFRRQSVQESFEYRATGGDHRTMPWQQMQVVRAPRLEDLTVVAHPPAYTGHPRVALEQRSQVLVHSRLELSGVIDQPVKSVSLRGESLDEMALVVEEGGKSFRLETEWIAKQSDNFCLNYVTPAGLSIRSERVLTLEVLPDSAPRVTFQQPIANLSLLPTAELPIAVSAEDNLALRRIDLVCSWKAKETDSSLEVSLWEALEETKAELRERRKEVEYLWNLEPMKLSPGTVLTVVAQATDYQPKVGRTTRPRTISIVSESELLDDIHERETRIASEIERLLHEQRRLRASFVEWHERNHGLSEKSFSELHVGLFHQRNIAKRLADNPGSVLAGVVGILEDLEINRLERPAQLQRLEDTESLLRELAATTMPTLEQKIAEFVRSSEMSSELKNLGLQVQEVLLQQDEAVATLEEALERLQTGGKLGTFERELRRLYEEQKELTSHCEGLAPRLLQTESAEVIEEVLLCNTKQRQLRRLLAGLLRRMSLATDQIAQESPTLASRVQATVILAREQSVEAMMIEAADHLADNRLGRALPTQRQVQQHLKELLNRYTGRDTDAAAKRIKQMKQLERELERLRRKVDQSRQALQASDKELKELERLRRENQNQADEADKLAKKLERLQVPSASQAMREASVELRKRLAKLPVAEKALKKLAEAQQRLAEERKRQQVALARLEMAKLETLLNGFVGRQERIHEEMLRLNAMREETDRLSASQQQSVLNLASVQQMLREDVAEQGEQFGELPVYVFALQLIGETMQDICNALQVQETGQPTQQCSQKVLEQLRALVSSVKQERKNLDEERKKAGGGGRGGGKKRDNASQAQSFQVALGQLKLLKSFQLRLQKETRALESRLAAGEEGEEISREAERLSRQQQRLLEVAEQLQPRAKELEAEEMFPDLEKELEQL